MSTPPQTTSPAGRPPSKPPSDGTKKDKGSRTSTPLNELLASFNATWLGEGDINAGTNLLVAEVITLSNLCRTGCGIQLTELNRMKAGCSLFVGGALSSSFISEMRGEVAILQNNLTAHLCRFVGDKIADAQKKGLKLMEFPSGPGANAAENALFGMGLMPGAKWVALRKKAARLLDRLRHEGPVTKTDLLKNFHLCKQERDVLLEQLAGQGLLRVDVDGRTVAATTYREFVEGLYASEEFPAVESREG